MIMKWKFGSSVMIEDFQMDESESISKLHGDAFVTKWSADEIALTLSKPNVYALTLRHKNILGWIRLVGFVIYRVAADEAEIITIAVARKRRRRGFGQLLMEEVFRRLYHDRIKKLFVEVDEGSFAAVNFYRKLDFKKKGSRSSYYARPGEKPGSALIMRHDLKIPKVRNNMTEMRIPHGERKIEIPST